MLAVSSAKKPDDWDDEEDGEWEAPIVTNPKVRRPAVADVHAIAS